METMKEIISKLNTASDAYYNTGKPIMTDQEFDLLLEQLKKLEENTGVILSNSPSINIGHKVADSIGKINHEHNMLSLSKVHSEDELLKFADNKECIMSIKLDGLSISATYEDGKLQRLETRGDGLEGKDIMIHASSFLNLPLRIKQTEKYVIDGECIICYDDFEMINDKMDKDNKYANPRNLASGSLTLLDTKESAKRKLRFVAWSVIEGSTKELFSERLIEADILGFTIVPFIKVQKNITKETLSDNLILIKQLADDMKYPMDGAVLTYNDVKYGRSLGENAHNPLHSTAYKYQDSTVESKVIKVDWTMGKTGALTPVCNFEPVVCEGSIISKASLHNLTVMSIIHPSIGCTCHVFKANLIIPQIQRCDLDGESEIIIPTQCPYCGGDTARIKDNESEILYCTNPSCNGKLLGKLNSYVSKSAMNIDGLSESTLRKFIELGLINEYCDIYNLNCHKNDLIRISGFGLRSITKLLESIENSKRTTLERFLSGLSIAGIGKVQSKIISNHFEGDWEKFIEAIECGFDFSSLPKFGDVLNRNIYVWYNNGQYETDHIDQLSKIVQFENAIKKDVSIEQSLKGMSFVITGKVKLFDRRDEIKQTLEKLGAEVTNTVTSKTTALVNNDINSTSSKNKKAKQLGVRIINEKELLQDFIRM